MWTPGHTVSISIALRHHTIHSKPLGVWTTQRRYVMSGEHARARCARLPARPDPPASGVRIDAMNDSYKVNQLNAPSADPPFRTAMAPTVAVLRELTTAIGTAAEKHGHTPWADSPAMGELAVEAAWTPRLPEGYRPATTAHALAELVLVVACDCGRCYAELFAGDRAPVYAHMVRARAILESCALSSWLAEPGIGAEERAKRGLCELLASAAEREKLPWVEDDDQRTQLRTQAQAMGWDVSGDRRYPVVGGVIRPSTGDGINALLGPGTGGPGYGRPLWTKLSGVLHGRFYALSPAIGNPIERTSGIEPEVAYLGTNTMEVDAYSFAIVRALRSAGSARMRLMGWADGAWDGVCERAQRIETALLNRIATAPTPVV